MKHTLFVTLALTAALGLRAHPADACTPAPTCSQQLCMDADGVLEVTVIAVTDHNSDGATATLEVVRVFGDGDGAVQGEQITLASTAFAFHPDEVGITKIAFVQRDGDGELAVLASFGPDFALDFGYCYGEEEATLEQLAASALSATCGDEFVDRTIRCVALDDGGCSTSGSSTLLLGLLALLGIVLRRPRTR